MPASSPRTLLLAGATGLVGRACLSLLKDDERLAEVRALVRRELPREALGPRVRECCTGFDHLQDHAEWFEVDAVLCALGTTIKQAGSREAFRRVDFEYPLAIARAARERGAAHVLLVSALGADPASRVFYNRVKGELEEAIQGLGYPSVTLARPSLLLGDRTEWRLGEEFAKQVGWLFPPRWRPVKATAVAAALVQAAFEPPEGVRILENPALRAVRGVSGPPVHIRV